MHFPFLSSILGAFRTNPTPTGISFQPVASTTPSSLPPGVSPPALGTAPKRTPSSPLQRDEGIKRARLGSSVLFSPMANDTTSPIYGNGYAPLSGCCNCNIPAPDPSILRVPNETVPTRTNPREFGTAHTSENDSSTSSQDEENDLSTSPRPVNNNTPLTTGGEPSKKSTKRPAAANEIPMHSKSSSRPVLKPVPKEKRRHPTRSKRDIKSEITFEKDNATLPKNYIGTWNGMQFYEIDYGSPSCGAGRHQLVCGHWISCSKLFDGRHEPCGLNCMVPEFTSAPFNCPQCTNAVIDVLDNQLTQLEEKRLEEAKKARAIKYIIGYMVEYAVKYTKLSGNFTETVQALLDSSFGRKCEACPPPSPPPQQSVEEMVRGLYERRSRKAFEQAHMNKKGRKRKSAPATDEGYMGEQEQREEIKTATHKQPPNRQQNRSYYKTTTHHELPSAKRRRLSKPVRFGTATFHNPPPTTVGALVRKRSFPLDLPVQIGSAFSKTIVMATKKPRRGGKIGDGNEEPEWAPTRESFTKVRTAFPVFGGVSEYDEDEEL